MGNIADKLVAAIASREAIRVKFSLPSDLPFSEYAENISGSSAVPVPVSYGFVDEDGNLVILDLTGTEPSKTDKVATQDAVLFETGFVSIDDVPDYDTDPELMVGQPLTFRLGPASDFAQISLNTTDTNRDSNSDKPRDIQYKLSSSGEWLPLNGQTITLAKGGEEYVQFKNNANQCSYLETADGTTLTGDFLSFVIEGEKVECYGDVNSMRNFSTEPLQEGEFYQLFYNCLLLTTAPVLPFDTIPRYGCMQMFRSTGISHAPALPATAIGEYGYYGMFNGCGSLKTVDELPAKTLSEYCYGSMFSYCIALGIAPKLPATTLAPGCYLHMFSSCTNLTVPPELPSTELVDSCYRSMFYMCKALKSAPALPATEMAEYCYGNMFAACSGLLQAPALQATTLAPSCYRSMFEGCTSLATAPALPATTLTEYCYGSMFRGCASLTTAPTLPATTLAKRCYSSMIRECTSLRTAPALPATTLADECYIYMFQGDTVLATAPVLPAGTLTKSCYEGMFRYCPEIKEIHIYASRKWSATNCANWLDGVAATGDLYCVAGAAPATLGVSTIPEGWTIHAEY